jgi:hypothetical protein
MLTTLGTLDIIVVVALLLFLVIASMYSSLKKKDAEEYFMANHSLRWWSVAGSIFGTNDGCGLFHRFRAKSLRGLGSASHFGIGIYFHSDLSQKKFLYAFPIPRKSL